MAAGTRFDDERRGGPDETGASDGSGTGTGPPDRPGLGICCSGGGIRSAAFNLGALQSLDRAGVLGRADYLSAVSGGAYIASAYAVATHRSDPELLAEQPAFAPGTPEESWVRHHCSYITNGFADTVRVLAVVLVGFIANIVYFTTLLWAVARPLGWLYAWWQPGLRVPSECPGQSAEAATGCGDATLVGLSGWATAAAVLIVVGLGTSLGVRMFQPSWPMRRYLRRTGVSLVGAGVLVGVAAVVLPEVLVAVRNVLGGNDPTGAAGVAAGDGSSEDTGTTALGVVAGVGGTVTIAVLLVRVARTLHAMTHGSTRAVGAVAGWVGGLSRGLRRLTTVVLGTLIGPLALAAVALLILNGGAQSATPSWGERALWAAMVLLALIVLTFADVTAWSLHPFYKWRLANTFAVRRVADDDPAGGTTPAGGAGPTRRAKASLLDYSELLTLSSFGRLRAGGAGTGPSFPELLVCAAINVSDTGTTPPGRSCLSFVFSPTTVGHPGTVTVSKRRRWIKLLVQPQETSVDTERVGPLEMPTLDYERMMRHGRRRDVTLSAAVAMSGAAVAPSMGKMTRAPLRFLLALTNVRLGVWLPNPANMPRGLQVGGRPVIPAAPRQVRLLHEVIGRHRITSKFLYVTDGGHIENLGLVELLRRRCRTIVCLDAAGGSTSTFSTLGEAISLAASELNVAIDIDPTAMAAVDGVSAVDHVVGTIRYPDGTRGTLVYGKALVTTGASWDVRAFAVKDPQFPTHPTVDQLYTGEMFDAYQSLGRDVGAACAAALAHSGAPATPAEPTSAEARHRPLTPPRRRARPGRTSSRVTEVRIRDVATAATELD